MSRLACATIALALVLACGSLRGQSPAAPEQSIVRLPPTRESEPLPPPSAEEPKSPSDRLPEVIAPPEDSQSLLLGESAWLLGPTYWDPWEGTVELGLSGTEGNSQTFNVRFGMTAKHKTETLVRTLQITSIQKSADNETTANTALLDGRLEWPMPESRWNYFMHGLIEYDQFKAFEYRISGDTGFGYEFIQTDATLLMGRAGVSTSREIGGPDEAWNPEILFGGEFKHKFNPTHTISCKADYYPNVEDFGDFRLNSQASWEIALASAWGLSLKVSVIDRYDSTPQGAKPNDLDYSTLLLWTF
jgi:putative salt-induced outer membrane protein YdiY